MATPRVVPSMNVDIRSRQVVHKKRINIAAGLCSGVIVAGLFNPWDRALYLSCVHRTPFLQKDNWTSPYRGFWQALGGRTISGGLYFPMYDIFYDFYDKLHHSSSSPSSISASERQLLLVTLAGNSAGAVNGVALNTLNVIKYHSWEGKHGFLETAQYMWRKGGYSVFGKGISATVSRDMVFGGSFAILKYGFGQMLLSGTPADTTPSTLTHVKLFSSTLVAAALSTVLSSPLNYARNIKYSTDPQHKPASSWVIVRDLVREARVCDKPWTHLQERLRIGWGTARVAAGMAVGLELYEKCKGFLEFQHRHWQHRPFWPF